MALLKCCAGLEFPLQDPICELKAEEAVMGAVYRSLRPTAGLVAFLSVAGSVGFAL